MAVCVGGLCWMLLSRMLPGPWRGFGWPWLVALLFVWHFLVVPVVAIPSVLLSLVAALAQLLAKKRPAAAVTVGVQDDLRDVQQAVSRRSLLQGALVSAPPLIAIATTARSLNALDEFRIRRISVPLPNLPGDLDGLTIAHVSDTHVGPFTRGRTLEKIVAATNDLRADLVLQTGDLINHALADLPAAIEMSRKFEGRFGMYMCEGNHDLIEDRDEFERQVRAAGLQLLLNESAELTFRGVPVQLMGLRWGYIGGPINATPVPRTREQAIRASMLGLLPQRREDAFPILLAHHPHAFDYAANARIPLTLSGHTHGGQIMASSRLGFGPWMFRYWSGLYQKDGAALVVSNGVGNWFPVRVNAPAEIIHITLRRA